MSLEKQIMEQLKAAMKSKNTLALQALRAVKSAIILAKTATGSSDLSEEEELKILQKQVKQRKDSAALFIEQGREDLAAPELAEATVIEQFLPEALTEEEVESVVIATIENIEASGMKDMGKVMGIVSKELAGKADGKVIATFVKKHLM